MLRPVLRLHRVEGKDAAMARCCLPAGASWLPILEEMPLEDGV